MADEHPWLDLLDRNIAGRCRNERAFDKALIHENQIECIEITRPFVDRLDTSHDHRMLCVPPFESSGVHSDFQFRADQLQLVDRLLQQLFDVREDQHASIPGLHGIAADRRHHRRLTATSRDHDDRIVIVFPQVLVNSVNSLLLIGTKRQHDQ